MSAFWAEMLHGGLLALMFVVPVCVVGGLLVLRMRRRSITAMITVLVLVPLVAAIAGMVGTGGFMYTPQLAGTLAVVAVVAIVTVPAGLVLGRRMAREMLWQREMLDAERRAEEARRELVAGMSHDLRSPLAGITGMTEALLDGVVSDPGDVKDYLQRIDREAQRTSGMVEDLFQLSRATSPGLRLRTTRVALGEVASDAVAAEATTARERGITFTAGDPAAWPTVRASEAELTRVVRNLLGNAARYAPEGSEVRLAAGVRDGAAWLSVADSCGGIPADDIDRIFEAGYRGTPARTPGANSGAGLGLAIAKALVEAQSGTISVRNEGAGCRFEITLPPG
jgi:signal transduction histidine kinase